MVTKRNDKFPDEINGNGNNTSPLYQAVPQAPIASVEQIVNMERIVLSTKDMRLRSNISSRLVGRLVVAETFASHYKSKEMRNVIKYVLELHTSAKGWGMGNLVQALQALRPSFYDSYRDSNSGIGGTISRVMGGKR